MYASIDIETTGLDPLENQTLQVGIVLFDPSGEVGSVIDELDIIVFGQKLYGDAIAFAMNNDLIKEISEYERLYTSALKEFDRHNHVEGNEFHLAMQEQSTDLKATFCQPEGVADVVFRFLKKHGVEKLKLNVAGKNFASLDGPFLRELPGWQENVPTRHRVYDVGPLYYQEGDTELPCLSECVERAGVQELVDNIPGELHNAVWDAKVVALLIQKFNARNWR